jgi:hypothetical protein
MTAPSFDVGEVSFNRDRSFFTGAFLPVVPWRIECLCLLSAHGQASVRYLEGPDCGVEFSMPAARRGWNLRALSEAGSLDRPIIDAAARAERDGRWEDMACKRAAR